MTDKWSSEHIPETCSYCQWEIFPGNTLFVSDDKQVFDKLDCVKNYVRHIEKYPEAAKALASFGTPKEYVLADGHRKQSRH